MSERQVDYDLVQRVQRGDKKAFDMLVLKYQQKILRLISHYIRDSGDALDIAQETFIKAYRALPRFRGESAFYTWLYRIAINTAKNYLIVQNRYPLENDTDIKDYVAETYLKDQATPEHLLIRDEIAQTIDKTINELPDELRTAIILRELEGLGYAEIAEVMDCPIGTVRSRIFRAREAIDEKINPFLAHFT
ncbi:RNA polymerase sigma factor RpoE [Candidatus Nitrosacidococcus tergens]|uniref:RNA polymerase sigma factor n=1 Tax=Candidatus Nitrosacidococcus tergens TaxID=553981 RepID=A0A7G1QAJ8_9GAMM|nr:RNA polymerase sigma factor RpoE [Candidatus Nitrosacidococcus tergens]CAB1276602.1 RNA polymerase, sigma 24 (sigma E) factor [Candidatus Nitrosacidococcus tergens]